ncbi:hypothetical protein NRIC_17020 [Enterococcus florum]|uniref:Uncharacterized protein n=1 Tax=Enterococcus florum TaxID=2480627 RepID=A0A4P5PBZ9_9ENTE|nr:hypothetical protein NRIC_17020 [Enterococcus florum]
MGEANEKNDYSNEKHTGRTEASRHAAKVGLRSFCHKETVSQGELCDRFLAFF